MILKEEKNVTYKEVGIPEKTVTQKRHKANDGMTPAPMSVDWSQHLSEEGSLRQLASLRVLLSTFSGIPGVVGLHGGLPAADAFPFTEMSFTLRDGSKVVVNDPVQMATAQQYSVSIRGYQPLYDWIRAHTWRMHSPPGDHDVTITVGSNNTLESLMSLLLNKGDTLLAEEFTYPHVVESFARPRGYKVLGIRMDGQGMVPQALEDTLTALQKQGGKMPRVLYTVPVGQNPTGISIPLERRWEIYAICRQHDIVIIEDDPYFYLQWDLEGRPLGLQNLGQSYLSLDTDGRVVRLDSFAKVLAPGLRMGWATAAPGLLEKLIFQLHGSLLGPTSLSQVTVGALLTQWGDAGFEAHVKRMQQSYAHRASTLHAAAEEHLGDLASWRKPTAGMFAWMKLQGGITDADQVIEYLKEEKVVVVPGRVTHCEGPRPDFPCPYIRVSFSQATDADLRDGMQRLSVAIKRYQKESAAHSFGHIATAVPCEKIKADSKHDAPALSLHAAAHTAANTAPDL